MSCCTRRSSVLPLGAMHRNFFRRIGLRALILALLLAVPIALSSLSAVGAAFVTGSVLVTGTWLWSTFRRVRPVVRMRDAPRILRESYLFAVTGLLIHGGLRLELLLLPIFRPLAEVGLFAAADRFVDLGFKVAILGS